MAYDPDFQRRLEQACSASSLVPDKNAGRLVFIAEQMRVSVEAVRKWFEGGRPRQDKMTRLAKLLNVDAAWLSMGVNAEIAKASQDKLNTQLEGATNVMIGLLTMEGIVCALPDEQDYRKDVIDFYAVIKGRQVPFVVLYGEHNGIDGRSVRVRREFNLGRNIVVLKDEDALDDITLLFCPVDAIDKCKYADGADWRVTILKREDGYYIGQYHCIEVKTIEDFL